MRGGWSPYTDINWSLHLQILNAVIAPLSTADDKLMYNRSQILGNGTLSVVYSGRLDRFCFNSYNKWTVTWMNSYLNIFPCFSISRLEMLPLFLEPKLREKIAGKAWEESESVSNLKQLGSFSVTIGNQGANRRGSTFLASCTNNVFICIFFFFFTSKSNQS